jgi:hypothetical protein
MTFFGELKKRAYKTGRESELHLVTTTFVDFF